MSTVSVEVVFETHSWSEDNDRGLASGWLPGRLSPRGRALAREVGRRRQHDGLSAVFSSDLRRATETAELAFTGGGPPTFADWRLRECNFGELNGAQADSVHADRRAHLYDPYPGGESWQQAVDRAAAALADIAERWAGSRVLVIGHVATRWALDCMAGARLDDLIDVDFVWREGWTYYLDDG